MRNTDIVPQDEILSDEIVSNIPINKSPFLYNEKFNKIRKANLKAKARRAFSWTNKPLIVAALILLYVIGILIFKLAIAVGDVYKGEMDANHQRTLCDQKFAEKSSPAMKFMLKNECEAFGRYDRLETLMTSANQ